MKKLIASLLILALGLGLIWSSKAIKQNPEKITTGIAALKGNCTPYTRRCRLIAPIVTEAQTVSYGLKRENFSKDELPIIRVYMSDGAIAKLQDKRRSVFDKQQPIHISNKEDWVKGEAIVEFENRKEKSKTRMRLKGDWPDHLAFPRKLSLRIKTRSGGYLFGMKALSVQHPSTRSFGMGPMVLAHMDRHDILSPRQRFVDMYVNDIPVGVMSMEEHFGKEMIEAHDRRDGPLLAISEDPMWAQWDVNYNRSPIEQARGINFFGYRDGTIKDYNESKFDYGSIATQNRLRGETLLRDFLEGREPARNVFDFDRLAKFFVLTNIWNGCHGLIWHNRRFYFNPISGLLEPVSFDNNAIPYRYKMCIDVDIQASFQDPLFVDAVRSALDEVKMELESEEFEEFMAAKQSKIQKAFSLEHFSTLAGKVSPSTVVKPATLLVNWNALAKDIEGNLTVDSEITTSKPVGFYGYSKNSYLFADQGPIDLEFLKVQDDIVDPFSARYFYEGEKGTLAFRNLTLDEITLQSVFAHTRSSGTNKLEFEEIVMNPQDRPKNAIELPLSISQEKFADIKSMTIEYLHKGKVLTRKVDIQYRKISAGFVQDPIAALSDMSPAIKISNPLNRIVFDRGVHNISQSISLPMGVSVVIEAGAEINFTDGALLKINGPLSISGKADQPVLINVRSNLTKGNMGAWGGILVSKAKTRSIVQHLKLTGTGKQNLNSRQGYFGMTGCLSFYESDVDIVNADFINAQCEDALNIVKADFKIDKMLIKGARADAFDSDFSTGLITDSDFVASGNDGVDVSGTLLNLDNIRMTKIGDKAISVGEKSTLLAENIDIDGAVLGIVSKDLSKATANNVRFSNLKGTALMGYIKKAEYGPSAINCQQCKFDGGFTRTGVQEGNTIILNGEPVTGTTLSRQQMLDAGLIVEGLSQ